MNSEKSYRSLGMMKNKTYIIKEVKKMIVQKKNR